MYASQTDLFGRTGTICCRECCGDSARGQLEGISLRRHRIESRFGRARCGDPYRQSRAIAARCAQSADGARCADRRPGFLLRAARRPAGPEWRIEAHGFRARSRVERPDFRQCAERAGRAGFLARRTRRIAPLRRGDPPQFHRASLATGRANRAQRRAAQARGRNRSGRRSRQGFCAANQSASYFSSAGSR
jgi:hypothetical protein